MNERDGFIAAIKAEPADDTRRLAYADWLDENAQHDRDKATAEFIRMSCTDILTGRVRKALDPQVGKWLGGRVYNGPMHGDGSLNMGRLIPTLSQWIDEVNRDAIQNRGRARFLHKREGRWLKTQEVGNLYTATSVEMEFWRGFVRRVNVVKWQDADDILPLLIADQPLCEPGLMSYAKSLKQRTRTYIYKDYIGPAIWRHLDALVYPWKADLSSSSPCLERLMWEDWETRPELLPQAERARWALCIAMHAAAREIMEGKREPGVGALMTEEVTK